MNFTSVLAIKDKLIELGILAVVIAVVIVGSYIKGRSDVFALWNAEKARQDTIAKNLTETQHVTTDRIQTEYKEVIKTVTVKGDTIYKKVPVYVTKADDAKCVIPPNFARVWNSANTGTVP
jgi:Flp pilus assembly pilin Flp